MGEQNNVKYRSVARKELNKVKLSVARKDKRSTCT
jgi:hypothetical protein